MSDTERLRIRHLVKQSIAGKAGDPPWQWCSFADGSLPEGSQHLGVAIVRAWNVGHAASVCWERGCNPGGQVMALEIPADLGPPPPEWDHKLVRDRGEIERLTASWHQCGLMTVADIVDAS